MTYIVQEIQTTDGTTILGTPQTYTDRNAAESAYHSILFAAAVSAVHEHTAMIYTQDGRIVRAECYKHAPAPVETEE